MFRKIIRLGIVSVLICVLSGCSGNLALHAMSRIDVDVAKPAVAQIIDENRSLLQDHIMEDIAPGAKGFEDGIPEGEVVVDGTMQEEGGTEYVQFCYAVSRPEMLDERIMEEYAQNLLDEDSKRELDERIEETSKSLNEFYEEHSKSMSPGKQRQFFYEIKKLGVRAIVLLTAAAVYACVPNVVVWGKVTAAAAVAVAAGIVASTLMAIYGYYKWGGTPGQTFEMWLKEVTSEPQTAYAVAASMMAVGASMKRSPVATALIIAVFAIYDVGKNLKPLLNRYHIDI